ncbi:MAG: sugar ABC transporter substrate-binding protein [Candidatus Dormibacteraeota bacterium]|nr:sugar ABC transporter substrate-binding protein [Candidatus Dormibacteraeota bacterium]
MTDDLSRRDLFKRSAYVGASVAALPGLAAFLDACANGGTQSGTSGGNSARSGIKIGVVTHGQASDPFWSVAKNGAAQAAKDMGVQYSYDAPTTFDMVKMSQLIDAEVARKPDGLVVSIPDPAALKTSITNAVQAGIPVVSINSGADVFQQFGILTHVGQTELIAGKGGGEQLGKAGVMKGLCVNQEQGNAALEQRFQGFKEGLAATSGGSATELVVDLNNPTDTQQKITTAIQQGGYDGVLTLGPTGAIPAIKALQGLGKLGSVKLGSFDLSSELLGDIANGQALFAIDQQQYLQGYLPVVFLTLYKLYLLIPGGGQPVLTGPSFITKATASRVIDLSKQGIR